MNRVVLVGFMGSGKSTIGKELAEMLALPLIEMDHEIELLSGKSIATIFKEKGEQGFRQLETQVLKDSLQKTGIIATGGGVVTQEENLALLEGESSVVYLKGKLKTLLGHIQHDLKNNRPLAKDTSSLRPLFESRKQAYEKIATHEVIIDDKSVATIVAEIVAEIE